ncbi:MAG TPA: S8 family serine peptidase [Firmicutes bacterium]|nr:S8 family serine peptidase [Bacillota bacterium]
MRPFDRLAHMGLVCALVVCFVMGAGAQAAGPGDRQGPDFPVVEVKQIAPQAEYAEGEVLVRPRIEAFPSKMRLEATSRAVETLTRGIGAVVAETITLPNEVPVYRVKLDPSKGISVEEAVAYYEKNPSVEYAEPNWKRYAYQGDEPPVNDEYFGRLWGLHNTGQTFRAGYAGRPDADIDAPEAWASFDSDQPVVVAIIDTGVQYYHPDLAENMWVNEGEIPNNDEDDDNNGFVDDIHGWDFVHDDNTVYDELVDPYGYPADMHGTHTSGTVAALGNNGVGVVGVAWKANVKIMALKFIGENGYGYDSDAIKAFDYAARMGASLTSNSWGGGGYGKALREAIEASGILAVCAAGNSATDNDVTPHYPSSYVSENIIAVAATDWNDEMASFSCWGAESVDIAAPGSLIYSTSPSLADLASSAYVWLSGTSMATPHVSGVVALLVGKYPNVPQYKGAVGWHESDITIKDMILNSSDVRPAFVGKVLTGGRLNAYNALMGIWPPAIHEVHADRMYGAPGALTVTFSASASSRPGTLDAAPIADQWWDFGDGSAPVHAATATHTYTEEGSYTATFHVVDSRGNESTATIGVVAANPDTVLFVDDDEGMDYDEFFTQALAGLERPFLRATASTVASFPTDIPNPIIWNCGEAYSGTLLAADQAFLSQYLDNGGRLFLSGYDILYDLISGDKGPDFVAQYLHVEPSEDLLDYWYYAGGVNEVLGKAADPVSDGMDITLEYPGSYDRRFVDGVIPRNGAVSIFEVPPAAEGDPAIPVAVRYADSVYRVVFLGFPFEAVPSDAPEPNNSTVLMDRILRFLTAEDTGEDLPPAVTSVSANVQVGVAPLEVTFTAAAHDAEGDIAGEWDFGDGTPPAAGMSATHVYAEPGVYTVTFTATDSASQSASRSLTVVAVESRETVLLVDGDGNAFDLDTTRDYIEPVMQEAGVPYRYVLPDDVISGGLLAPGAEQFMIVWNCGLVDYPSPGQVAALKQYLKKGGRLFIAGQELIYGVGMNFTNPDDFVIKYLHVADANSDVQSEPEDVFTGVEGDPITDGLSFEVNFEAADIPSDYNWIDEIYPDADAVGIFTAPDGTYRALRQTGDGYKVVFLAFPLEVVPGSALIPVDASRQDAGEQSVAATLLSRAYNWLLLNEVPVVTVSVPESAVCADGRGVDIGWTAHDPDGPDDGLTIRIEYSMDEGATWTLIADGEANDGLYAWDGAGVKKGGKALIRVSATDPQGATGVAAEETTLVVGTNMLLAGPNPASSKVTFYYNIPDDGTLFIYDIAGRLVYSADLAAGSGAAEWSLVDDAGRDLANGLYVAILVTERGLKSDPIRLIIRR